MLWLPHKIGIVLPVNAYKLFHNPSPYFMGCDFKGQKEIDAIFCYFFYRKIKILTLILLRTFQFPTFCSLFGVCFSYNVQFEKFTVSLQQMFNTLAWIIVCSQVHSLCCEERLVIFVNVRWLKAFYLMFSKKLSRINQGANTFIILLLQRGANTFYLLWLFVTFCNWYLKAY